MTVRTAEIIMALVMSVFSIYLMIKSAELPIGWIPDEGPGGGAWPFWLAAIMLLCCLGIIYNWVRKHGKIAQSTETYIRHSVLIDVAMVAGSLIVTVALFHWIGIYGALPFFLMFYLKFLGKHSLPLSVVLSIGTPVAMFFFFEIMLKITLPKGVTEPLFYPLYKIFL